MKRLFEIYAMIPTFRCKPGCNDCCGPVPFLKFEWERIADKRLAVEITCPYTNTLGGCDIYHQRPLMCRLFGAVNHPQLICPHGCGPPIKLDRKLVEGFMSEYLQMMRGSNADSDT